MHKPLKVLGYQRQHVHGNWKFYNENLRDLLSRDAAARFSHHLRGGAHDP